MKNRNSWITFFCVLALLAIGTTASAKNFTNSVAMEMVQIQPGTFQMGRLNPADKLDPGYSHVVDGGDWDEKPVHTVKISKRFFISKTEVTAEQYRMFDPSYSGKGQYATGVSWDDAMAFALWLGQKEGKPYRLPTEAEWEYVCRADTSSFFWSGDTQPQSGQENPWGVVNMHSQPQEWVYDWYGKYLDDDQIDPVGPSEGFVKVVRGGEKPYDARSASRCSVPPGADSKHKFEIGFRLVQAPLPETKPIDVTPFPQQCVKQNTEPALAGPDADKPYFNRRWALPIPAENDQNDMGPVVGIDPTVLAHCHSPGFAAMLNGDLLAVYFSSSTASTESERNTTFVQARLRNGSNQWDMPEQFVDFANFNDQSALLWDDEGTIRVFLGGRGWPGNVPFKWAASMDNGATWSPIKLPTIIGEPGSYTPQPITSFFRDPEGNMYFNMDASGSRSLLWRSSDEGKSWMDMGGRTEGRHSAIMPIKDADGKFSGTLLCLGTKKGLWRDNWMQQNISRDWGRTWEPKTKATFPYLSSNQRGCLRRLADGKLIFASDHQSREGKQPEGYTMRGAFIAISDDEGKSWHVKTVPGTLPHEGRDINAKRAWTDSSHRDGTFGYVTLTQTPNGLIHLLATMNQPCLHFEFNEAWIYSDAQDIYPSDPAIAGTVTRYEEKYPDGETKASYSFKTAPDGRVLLDGTETYYYENGQKQYTATYKNGNKAGIETYWTPDGKKRWSFNHDLATGNSVWTQYWANGRKMVESPWQDGKCNGIATRWYKTGKVTSKATFVNGINAAN